MYKAMLTAALVSVTGLVLSIAADRYGATGLDAIRSAVRDDADADARVVVMIVRDRGTLERMRAVTGRTRLAASSKNAFAIPPDRIVTLGAEAAGELIQKLIWVDRKIEFIDLGTVGGPGTQIPTAPAPPPPGGDAALASKKTLTMGEAIRYLNQNP